MDNNVTENNYRENVILGIVGALLFSLIGGVVYFFLNLIIFGQIFLRSHIIL